MIGRTVMGAVTVHSSAQAFWVCCQHTSRRHAGCKGSTGSRCLSSPACPFATLGISESSSLGAVKAAYRARCQTDHPDVGGSEAEFRFIKEAYEECTRRVRERATKGHGASSKTSVHGTAPDPAEETDDGKFRRKSDAWYESHAKCLHDQRQVFYGAFPYAKTIEELDELFSSALRGHCFDTIDLAEPLVLVLKHYHLVTGYGASHLRSCFNAIDRWEEFTTSRAGTTMYHILLQLYTDGPRQGLTATLIAESVEAVMERMSAKGLEFDDWTLTLAYKAYRTSPYPF
ncbi:chaperone DnaJ protein [Trypanosoma conorhini]|uniref:Chaperone DnaJ protein n=1 Tax=Trypanosoma conorhini TaxID=83891 RepID=A0A3R7LFM9_9TRYP|nr:chaperone DnaJ protein [Trypanosoma conorhini]RNF13460.1 chaperone DnaJ protein [Trypanosoma conorhini]